MNPWRWVDPRVRSVRLAGRLPLSIARRGSICRRQGRKSRALISSPRACVSRPGQNTRARTHARGNDRFFIVDQRVTGGVQVRFCPQASLDLAGGYVFDRHFFEGKNITNGTGFNRLDVGAGPYASVQLQLRW
jgi:hypothetical protein